MAKRSLKRDRSIESTPGKPDGRRASDAAVLNELFEHAPAPAWIVDAEGTILKANRQAQVLCRLESNSDTPFWQLDCWSDASRDRVRLGIENAAARGIPDREEVALRGDVRGRGKLSLSIRPVSPAPEHEQLLVIEALDERTHDQVADALLESEARFHDAFDFAAIGMALMLPSGGLVQVNKSFSQIVGHSQSDLLKTTIQAITHPEDVELNASLLQRLLAGDVHFYHVEKRYVHRRGHIVWALESVSVVRDAQHRPVHLLCQIQDITDRKRAQEILLESEARFRGVLESAPDAILLFDASGNIALVNAQAELMFGYTRGELIGAQVELVLPGGLTRPDSEIDAVRAGLACEVQHCGQEFVAQRKDGSKFPVEVSFSPLDLPERSVAIGIIRDFSERRKAARDLEQRARQEAAIAEFGRTAVAQSDLDVLMDRATRLVAHTLGIACASVMELAADGSMLIKRSLSFDDHASQGVRNQSGRITAGHLEPLVRYALRTGEPQVWQTDGDAAFDASRLKSNGVASAAAVVVLAQNRQYGCLTAYSSERHEFSTEDVHFLEAVAYLLSVAIERKLAEETVRRDRDFAESLIGTAQAIVLVLDTQGRIVRFNPYTEELTGFRLENVQGSPWHMALLPPHHMDAGTKMFEDAARGDRLRSAILPVTTAQGNEREIDWSGRALTDTHGVVTGVLFIGHDITELRAAQKKLLESERLAAIGQMASGLAHESRNALQQIGACAEMLAMELENQPKALDLVAGVQEAEDRLHRLFDDVRAYAVPLRLDRHSANVAPVWRKAWQQAVAQHPERESQLVEDVGCMSADTLIDSPIIEQVFRNLFDNAFDAGAGPLHVKVQCSETLLDGRRAYSITLRDNGPGLSQEQYQKALLPFYTTKTQGTGLGLPIVKRLLEAHGGRIEIGPPGQPGAQFTIVLPRDA